MPDEPDELRARIRRERERAGLSLAGLATATGLSKSYLVRLETQDANPSLAVLGRIADALGVTVADLLGTPSVADAGEAPVPPALAALAKELRPSRADVRMLASIRFRAGEEPRTLERWRYIWNSLQLSRRLDEDAR